LKFRNEIKNKTYQTVVTVTKSNRKIVQTEATSIVHRHIYTHIHDHLLSCLGIETYICLNSYLIHDVIPVSFMGTPVYSNTQLFLHLCFFLFLSIIF